MKLRKWLGFLLNSPSVSACFRISTCGKFQFEYKSRRIMRTFSAISILTHSDLLNMNRVEVDSICGLRKKSEQFLYKKYERRRHQFTVIRAQRRGEMQKDPTTALSSFAQPFRRGRTSLKVQLQRGSQDATEKKASSTVSQLT